ncbi:MAG: FeoC-like transcriptional regulator [Leptolyngbyaceae cyanobacterium]
MILKDLQDYISEQHKVSLAQIEVKFGIEAAALRGMLSQLIYKKRVQKSPLPHRCHGCLICSQESLEFYEWLSPRGAHTANQDNVSESVACGGACHRIRNVNSI